MRHIKRLVPNKNTTTFPQHCEVIEHITITCAGLDTNLLNSCTIITSSCLRGAARSSVVRRRQHIAGVAGEPPEFGGSLKYGDFPFAIWRLLTNKKVVLEDGVCYTAQVCLSLW